MYQFLSFSIDPPPTASQPHEMRILHCDVSDTNKYLHSKDKNRISTSDSTLSSRNLEYQPLPAQYQTISQISEPNPFIPNITIQDNLMVWCHPAPTQSKFNKTSFSEGGKENNLVNMYLLARLKFSKCIVYDLLLYYMTVLSKYVYKHVKRGARSLTEGVVLCGPQLHM